MLGRCSVTSTKEPGRTHARGYQSWGGGVGEAGKRLQREHFFLSHCLWEHSWLLQGWSARCKPEVRWEARLLLDGGQTGRDSPVCPSCCMGLGPPGWARQSMPAARLVPPDPRRPTASALSLGPFFLGALRRRREAF